MGERIEDQISAWVAAHREQGHDATVTVAGAPGSGTGSWCGTCKTYGPNTFRVLTLGDVR